MKWKSSPEKVKRKLTESHPGYPTEFLWMQEVLGKPWRIFWLNFFVGIARGLGFALGVSLLSGVVIVLISKMFSQAISLPLVGSYLADFITEVQKQMSQIGRIRP
ncbi:MAG: hypothetical protein HY399_01860 [Elusimicrobia bacterium]|nr:hypothetical protein [Elusimicrobiota bacterium]